MHQSDAIGLGCGKAFGGEQVAAGVTLANGGQHERADNRRNEAQLDLGQRKLAVVGRDGDIAGRNQTHATTQRRPLNPRQRRLGKPVQRSHQATERTLVAQPLRRRVDRRPFHPVDVATGAKAFTGRRKHHHPHRRVGLQRQQAIRQFGDQVLVQRVMPLDLVQGQDADGPINFGNDRLIHELLRTKKPAQTSLSQRAAGSEKNQ